MKDTGRSTRARTALLWRLPWAWLLVAVLATVTVLLREISILLSRVESAGQQAFDSSVYTGFPSVDRADDIAAARELWHAAESITGSLVAWHLCLDLFVLTPALTLLLALSLRRVRLVSTWQSWQVWCLPLMYCAADLLETGVTAALFDCGWEGCGFPSEQPFYLIVGLSTLKWGALLATVTAIFVGFLRPGVNGQVSLVGSWSRLRGAGRPVGSAGGLSVVVIAFALVVALPAGGPLDQIPDVIRAQVEGGGGESVASAALAAVLVLAVLVAGAWSIRYEKYSVPTDPGLWRGRRRVVGGALAVSVLLVVIQLAVDEAWDGKRLGQPLAPLLTTLVIVGAACAVRRWQKLGTLHTEKPDRPTASDADAGGGDPWDDRRWRAIALLVALVVFALGLGLVRAFAPVVLTATTGARNALLPLVVGVVTAGLFAPGVAVLLTWTLDRLMPSRMRRLCFWLGVVVAGWTVVAAALLAYDPARAWGGATGVLSTCFAFFATITGLLGLASHRIHWRDTRTLGLGSRTPWVFVLILSWLLASTLDFSGGYHDARVEHPLDTDLPTLDQRFSAWREGWDEKKIKECATKDGRVPMVLVAAPGGGGKAAYWTGHAMDELFAANGPLCPQSLFAVSGVSGGAVGLAVKLGDEPGATAGGSGSDPLEDLTDDEPLAQVLAAMLLRDLPQPFVGAADGWPDRAEVLETAWEESTSHSGDGPLGTPDQPRTVDELGTGWWEGGDDPAHQPAIVLNSTSITDGCRVLVSNVGGLPTDARSCRAAATTRGWPPGGPVALSLDARAGLVDAEGTPRERAGTRCDDPGVAGMRASTAALMAARFPYLTPSGALRRCLPDGMNHAFSVTYGVDGGYLENTGLPALLEIWHDLAPQVDQCNTGRPCSLGRAAGPAGHTIEPWVIMLENHYRSQASTAPPGRPKELWVPLKGLGASETLRSSLTLEQQTAVLMNRPRASLPRNDRFLMLAPFNTPEVQAPLGWSLAESTRQRMRHDVTKAIVRNCRSTLFRPAQAPSCVKR